MKEFNKLFDIIKHLRSENGCPWDKKQTVETLSNCLLEETYEVIDAIDNKNKEDLEEELGDLFFLVLFITYIAEQENRFQVAQVFNKISEKLIRRHPHVFGDKEVDSIEGIIKNWEEIKLSEEKNKKRSSIFDGIPNSLPDIQKFYKVLDKIKKNSINIPSVSKEELNSSFLDFLQNFNENNIFKFLKLFLIYLYNNNIDLSYFIRNITQDIINNYNIIK